MRSFHPAIASISLLLATPVAFAQADVVHRTVSGDSETLVVAPGKPDATHVKSDPNGDLKDEVLQPP
jgi:hypothetical protein